MAGKEGTAGVKWTSGETRRGAGFDKVTCSAGFYKKRGWGKRKFISIKHKFHCPMYHELPALDIPAASTEMIFLILKEEKKRKNS